MRKQTLLILATVFLLVAVLTSFGNAEIITELTFENPTAPAPYNSEVYWNFDILNPDLEGPPGSTLQYYFTVENFTSSTADLNFVGFSVGFDPGLPLAYGDWDWDFDWALVSDIAPGDCYTGAFGHLTWTDIAPIGFTTGGNMTASAVSPPADPASLSRPYSASVAAVPEPATILLLGSGLIGLAAFGRRFRKK